MGKIKCKKMTSHIGKDRQVKDNGLYERFMCCVCFNTGTAAISVGFRTVASPLLPFLILVDCKKVSNTLKQADRS